MCISAMKRKISKLSTQADSYRYQKYAEAKARIPRHLPPREYEEEVKRLARRYRI